MSDNRCKVISTEGLLTRLRQSRRGNTLVMAAAAMVPLAGMVGGGLDLSRLYLVKTRLQHGCDAGALAGRKSMGAGIWTQSDNAPLKAANLFFDGNFEDNAYGSKNIQRSFTEAAGKVSGRAQADVPMTLMKIFSKPTQTLVVSCDAEMRLPNTDVMFVLDTTGSMQDVPSGDTLTKLDSLKVAVKCFYEIVARLDTDANCTTGNPSGGTGSQVQIRFGFVPYATNVNVGRLLKPEWFADSWKYQTRKIDGRESSGSWKLDSFYEAKQYDTCIKKADTDLREYRVVGPTRTYNGVTYGPYYCVHEYRDKNVVRWKYDELAVDVSLLKNGSSWRGSFQWPLANDGSNRTITWDGCIEERQTVRTTNFSPIPAGAKDLNIDEVPSDNATRWGMVLPGVVYTRNGSGGWNLSSSTTTTDYGNQSYYACPTEARLLQAWPNATDFDDYVDSLKPEGNTFHDIGLIWGARLMSPTGLFKADNATTSKGGDIERHMIFMTDGDACTAPDNYTAYGVLWFDRRQTPKADVPTGGCTDTGTLTEQVNLRTAAICSAVKNKNITLWVVAFGTLAPSTVTRLKACATSGRYFTATNAPQLQATFKSIADQISQLRLTS
ncbi:Flp pilus assembly protein TadG [Sphingomonas rubra]|uniref:Flp pilus assembly protein TadG n=2 Tax=Sphingomonas rubra TaxID=634430 RepID=A0A1I5UP50_9SPHN|nr:Flp pilus assembly protein TadG [Sphingomonas rubra]